MHLYFIILIFKFDHRAVDTTTKSSSSLSSDIEELSGSIKEINNRSRLQLLIELGREALLNKLHDNDTFSFSRDPKKLYLELQQHKGEIVRLRKRNLLSQDQYILLVPPTGDEVDSQNFGISIIIILLTNICGYKHPYRKWIPQASDVNDFANIVRIKRLRDEISNLTKVSDAKFNRLASHFVRPLVALGINQKRIGVIFKVKLSLELEP